MSANNTKVSRQRSDDDAPRRTAGKRIKLELDGSTNLSTKYDDGDSSVGLNDIPLLHSNDRFSGVEGGLEDMTGSAQRESIEAPSVDSRVNDTHQMTLLNRREKFNPGDPKDNPCQQCVRSALSGKSPLGDDLCREADGSTTRRCFRCAVTGHTCSPVAPEMIQLSRRLMVAVKESDRSMIKDLRVTMSTIQALIKEGTITMPLANSAINEDRQMVNEADLSMAESQKRQRLMALFEEAIDVLLTH